MNIKLFYTIKAVDEKIPSDIIQIIWDYVMNNSASMIQRMYIFKVSRTFGRCWCNGFSVLLCVFGRSRYFKASCS